MENIRTKSFEFDGGKALVTYDESTFTAITWSTKDKNGKFLPGVMFNHVRNYRLTVDEKHIFKYGMNGEVVGYNLDEVCEAIYRMYLEDAEIQDTDWAYLNIRSREVLEDKVLAELSQLIRSEIDLRFGDALRVAVDNNTFFQELTNPTVFYIDEEDYVIADFIEVQPSPGTLTGSVFEPTVINNSIHGTVTVDLEELAKAIHRIRRNPEIISLEIEVSDTGIRFTAVKNEERTELNGVAIPGSKFKLSNK